MLYRNRRETAEQREEIESVNRKRQQLDAAVSHLCSLSREEALALRDVNLFRWICSMMKISGSPLSDSRIGAMMDGETVREATVEEYQYLRSCMLLYSEFRHMLDMDMDLDEKYITRIWQILTGETTVEYRKTNPVLREMKYNPPHGADIEELMRAACREISSREHYRDPVRGAVRTHDMLMVIWPFEVRSGETAYAAMSYELLRAGYPLPALGIDNKEHLALSAEFPKKGTSFRLYAAVVDNLLDQCGGIQIGL